MIDNVDAAITFAPTNMWQSWSALGANWHMGTARSSNSATSYFEYSHPSCTQLRWWSTKSNDRATADVYVDGTLVANVTTYAAALTASSAVFDSGPLFSGPHTIKVVVKTAGWIECDAIEVTEAVHEQFTVDDTDPSIYYSGGWGAYTGVSGRVNLTAHSSASAADEFTYAAGNCSRIVWLATKDTARGTANVFVDGIAMGTVDLYGTSAQHQQVVFDSGLLPAGGHSLRVVCTGTGRAGVVAPFVELDCLRITGDPAAAGRVDSALGFIRYSGQRKSANGTWVEAWIPASSADFYAASVRYSDTQGSFAELTFAGPRVRWIGGRQENHGIAEVFIDGLLEATVDTYSATRQFRQVLFEKSGITAGRLHTIRIRVTRTKHTSSNGYYVNVDAFDADSPVTAITAFPQANTEIAAVANRTKSYLPPVTWQPVAYKARVPDGGVTMTGGPLRTCFDNNVVYLIHSAGQPHFVDTLTWWVTNWPTANEGRILTGGGHALRWTTMLSAADQASLRETVAIVVSDAKHRQYNQGHGTPTEGFALLWYDPSSPPAPSSQPSTAAQIEQWMTTAGHERANYDRAMWTRGMVAAVLSGNHDAGFVLRDMYDWFNRWHANRPTPVPALVTYSLGAQGHIGSTLAYHSPIGVAADLVTAEQFYVQDWWLEQLANQEPLSFSHYPHDRPHSYLVIALESYVDHYRGTGAQKYLAAALGGWEMFRRDFMFIGGGTAITEAWNAPFPAQGYDIGRSNNEFDGAIFWIHFNQRLLQLFPDQEKYAAEIERCIYNVALAQQDASGNHGIRYHGNMEGTKEAPTIIGTCCEVNGTGLYSRLPEMLYSIAVDGLYINMWEASTITWKQQVDKPQVDVTLTTSTTFPFSNTVQHVVATPSRVTMKIRIRVPSWASGPMTIAIGGVVVATGQPGTYVTLNRAWANGDTITYTLPASLRLSPYRGLHEIDDLGRYALQYGPILMAYLGSSADGSAQPGGFVVSRVRVAPSNLVASLQPVSGQPLRFAVNGDSSKTFAPYWQVQGETFNCFPIVQP